MIESGLRKALLQKLGTSPQAMYQRAERIKSKHGPMSTEDALSWIAVDVGIDVSKFLSKGEVDRIRNMRSAKASIVATAPTKPAPADHASPARNTSARGARAASFDSRSLHAAVVRRSRKLFVDGHRKDALRAAFQSVNNRVKRLTGSSRDGQALMADAFRDANPQLQMTALGNQSEVDEHNGTRLMMMGAMTGMRNPRAHEDKWEPDNDVVAVLDALSFASLLHRFLDRCETYSSATGPATA